MSNSINELNGGFFYRKGCRAAKQAGDKWPELCQLEVENIELTCREEITRQKAFYHKLRWDTNQIDSCLNAGPGERPQQLVEYNYRIGFVLALVTGLIILCEALFCSWAFDPFREVGPKKYLFALGMTSLGLLIFKLILNYLQKSLHPNRYLTLVLYMSVGAGFAVVVALLNLAVVRGFLLDALARGGAASEFYSRSGPLMILMFSAMAVAFALGGGLIMKEAGDRLLGSRSVLKIYRKREENHRLMTEIPPAMERLEAMPRICELNFSKGAIETLEKMRKQNEKRESNRDRGLLLRLGVFIGVLALILLLVCRAFAGDLLVVGLDLSLSQKATDYTGETEFSKNLRAIQEGVIPKLRPSSTLYILGITATSFASPYWILKAKTGSDPGYFGEVLKREVQGISEGWDKVSESLRPTEKFTDIFGFLNLAEMIFQSFPADKRRLLLYSDMRHCTPSINLEKPARIDPAVIEGLKGKIHIPALAGTEIYCLGVHCYGKSDLFYHSLRRFWLDFFALTKGTLRAYTNLREVNLH